MWPGDSISISYAWPSRAYDLQVNMTFNDMWPPSDLHQVLMTFKDMFVENQSFSNINPVQERSYFWLSTVWKWNSQFLTASTFGMLKDYNHVYCKIMVCRFCQLTWAEVQPMTYDPRLPLILMTYDPWPQRLPLILMTYDPRGYHWSLWPMTPGYHWSLCCSNRTFIMSSSDFPHPSAEFQNCVCYKTSIQHHSQILIKGSQKPELRSYAS